ncbi:MAG: accessory Sec system protein Asp1 [Lachnospiraceae bacterium]
MLYFIPAWYQKDQWCETEQSWQERRMHTEFDDSVKHIQLFHRNHTHPYRILLLSYTPNFRHFLHRQSVYHAPYWSCFDAIQEVRRTSMMVLSFHNLNWPEDIEFLYTPYVVVGMRRGVRYAQIEFGEEGNMIRIGLYKKGKIYRRNMYDDRGFVSSTILYEEGEPLYQDYLMENGEWKMRHFFSDGHVEINPEHPGFLINCDEGTSKETFSKLRYDRMEDVIGEVFTAFVKKTAVTDAFCIAMHELHAKLLQRVLVGKRKTILSFYLDRYPSQSLLKAMKMMQKADYIITDSREASEQIVSLSERFRSKITDITPYDSRADLGISQQLSIQKIMVPVDGLSEDRFAQLVLCLGAYLMTNDRVRVHLFTREAAYDRPQRLLRFVKSCLTANGMSETWVDETSGSGRIDAVLEEERPVRFYIEQCVDELSVSKCMKEQRVIVDMSELPELYLQISAISMGIPQIVCTQTQFVVDQKNGLVLEDFAQLSQALDFYLDGLANWNEAVVASYEMGKKFSTRVLVDKWKEVLEHIG